jgi:hypothetical protein
MNRKTPALVILIFCIFSPAAYLRANEVSEMWSRLYARAGSLEQKYAVMQHLIEQDDANLAPTLQTALEELISISAALKSAGEKETWTQLARFIVGGLGKLKAGESAQVLFACYQTAASPLLKSEALTAIGKVRGIAYTEQIALILKDLNLNPGKDAQFAEIVAFGCINALEKLKSPLGYKQVFYASNGWYSKRIKDRALGALPNMTDDPTDILLEIMRESIPDIKLTALQAADSSRAAEDNKISVAVLALETGLYEQPTDARQQVKFGELRKLAISMFIKYRTKNDAILEPLKLTIERNFDPNERLSAVTALGINGSDGAAKMLAGFLDNQNRRQASGLPDPDNRYTTALMRSLGITKNPIGRPALLAVEFSNYTPAMVKISKEALQEIDKR